MPDDHVVAGVQRAPLGTAEAAAKSGDSTPFTRATVSTRECVASTVKRLIVECRVTLFSTGARTLSHQVRRGRVSGLDE
jgi:hypothetical protein